MAKNEFGDLPWAEIIEISKKGIFEEVFKKIPKERFRFAVEDKNREILIESAMKSLKKKNSEATYEQAVTLTDLMQQFARKVLEG